MSAWENSALRHCSVSRTANQGTLVNKPRGQGMGTSLEREVARLTTLVAERQGEVAFATQENNRLRAERDGARKEISALSTEIGSLRAEQKHGEEERSNLRKRIADLEEVNKKQARTIKVQSDQIAAPKEVNRTPNRGTSVATNSQFAPPPAPVYNPPTRPVQAPQQPAPYVVLVRQGVQRQMSQSGPNVQHGQQVQPARQTQPGQFIITSQPVHSDQPGQRGPQVLHSHPTQPTLRVRTQPVQASNYQIPAPIQSTIGQVTSRSLVVQGDDTIRINWIEEFSQFFDLTLTFARNFGNVPDYQRDNLLTGRLITDLHQASHPNVIHDLLSSSDTRYYLVAAFLNQAICNEIFRSSLIRGFSAQSDAKIGEIRRSIQPGVKDSMKRGLLKAAADILNEMREAPDFKGWVEIQIDDKASVLWDRMKGLLSPEAEHQNAFMDLGHLYREAYRIGLMMYSLPLTWTLDFPQNTRLGSFFDPTTMINRDARFRGDPVSLREQRLRIRLGINPVIIMLDYMDDALLPRTVHYADVLLQT